MILVVHHGSWIQGSKNVKITGLPWSQKIGGDSVGHEGGGGYGAVNGMSPPHPAVMSRMAFEYFGSR
jgi:hypothetical protein